MGMSYKTSKEFRNLSNLLSSHMDELYDELLKNKKIICYDWKLKLGDTQFTRRKKFLLNYGLCTQKTEVEKYSPRVILVLTKEGKEIITLLQELAKRVNK